LALCHGISGPFVVFQPDWFYDDLEAHSLAAGAVPTTWRMEPGRRPTWLDDTEFRLVDFSQTWVNPSRAYEAFVTELLGGQTEIGDFSAALRSHCALDRQRRVLAGAINIKMRDFFAFIRVGHSPILATIGHIQPDDPNLLAVALHEGRLVAATFSGYDRGNQTLVVWQAPTSPTSGYASSQSIAVLSQIDLPDPPIASFEVIDGQLILAFKQRTEVTVLPLPPGPMSEPLRIPEQVTGLICGPDGILLMATSQGILAVRLRTGNNHSGPREESIGGDSV
jgi:hypothetical protein